MIGVVAAIIEHHVGRSEFIDQRLQECRVGLITDAHGDLFIAEGLAFLADIDANDPRGRAEIMLPHLGRSALPGADLKKYDAAIAKGREDPLIYRQVICPFIDRTPGIRPKIIV
jgi:hypothetical protein